MQMVPLRCAVLGVNDNEENKGKPVPEPRKIIDLNQYGRQDEAAKIDFKDIATRALQNAESFLAQWLPGGEVLGPEYTCASLAGGHGFSTKVNVVTGRWSEFADGPAGGDMISLYAAIKGVKQSEAARDIEKLLGTDRPILKSKPAPQPDLIPIQPVPEDAPAPPSNHFQRGAPTIGWTYRNGAGQVLGYVCRFDLPEGKKDIIPLTLWKDINGNLSWRWKGFPEPHPLYGLDRLQSQDATLPILMVEGEKTCDAATRMISWAIPMTWPGGGKAVKKASFATLKGRKVIVWPDADKPGLDAAQAVLASVKKAGAIDAFVVEPPVGVKESWDLADAEAEGWTSDQIISHITASRAKSGKASPLDGIISAEHLCEMEIPEPKWVVPGLIPEGLTVLAGNPKLGKSWIILQTFLAVGCGGMALGKFPVEKGRVLYLALEDSQRRLKDRINSARSFDPGLDLGRKFCDIHIQWPTMDEGGLEFLDQYAEKNPDLRAICIDTLVKLRPKTKPKGMNAYEVDSIHLGEIKRLADRRNLAVIVVTHLNKTKESGDPFDRITGSNGIFGTADTALLLCRSRGKATAELKATGRDIIAQDYAMKWHNPFWTIEGDAEKVASTMERQEILDVLKESDEPMKTQEIAACIGKSPGTISYLLTHLTKEGLIEKMGYGKYLYSPPRSPRSTISTVGTISTRGHSWLDDLDK